MTMHVVLMKFAPGASAEVINEIFAGFDMLAAKMPGVLSVAAGENMSPEGLDRGCRHGFVMDFESAKARDDYLEHPDPVAFAEGWVIPAMADGIYSICVFDYEIAG